MCGEERGGREGFRGVAGSEKGRRGGREGEEVADAKTPFLDGDLNA